MEQQAFIWEDCLNKVQQESKTEAGKWPPFSPFSETGLVLLYAACKCKQGRVPQVLSVTSSGI